MFLLDSTGKYLTDSLGFTLLDEGGFDDMSKGYIETTPAVENDLVYGEIKCYFNYGLPDQVPVGSVSDGVKISLERSISKIKFDGAYGAVKGLRRYEKFLPSVTINTLGLRHYTFDVISNCENDSANTWESKSWVNTDDGIYAADTTYYAKGLQSAKLTGDGDGEGIHQVFSASKDLTAFANGDASATSDYIGFSIYISSAELTNLGTASLRIAFHKDAEGTETNYYYYDVAYTALTADTWNDFKVLKSAFTSAGTPVDWSAILGMSLKFSGAPSAETDLYLDDVCIIQATPLTTIVPSKKYGGEWSYTDQSTYREYTPSLTIDKADYVENVTLISQKHDGKYWKYIFKKCLIDNALSMALEEKKELIKGCDFSAHYQSGNSVPFEIHEEV